MASSPLYFSLLSLLLLFTLASGSDLFLPKEKKTHLRLFLHEVESGANATIYTVVSLHGGSSIYSFGDIHVVDSVLREGPEPSSKLIGRAQGVVADVDLEGNAASSIITLVFTAGEYSGSTITLQGIVVPPLQSERTVIGGTGQFRMARGFAFNKMVSFDGVFLIAQVDVYVVHYDDLGI